MTLRFTARQTETLTRNWADREKASQAGAQFDPKPVVKVFTPDAGATWLIAAMSPDGQLAYGVADLGIGFVETGDIDLQELGSVRGRLGLPVEIDRWFSPDRLLSAYWAEGRRAGRLQI